MQLIGLDDNISRFGGARHGGYLSGLSDEKANECDAFAGKPCFQMGADGKSYSTEIFKSPYFWSAIAGYIYRNTIGDKVENSEAFKILWRQIDAVMKAGGKPYIELSDGRVIYLFRNENFNKNINKDDVQGQLKRYFNDIRTECIANGNVDPLIAEGMHPEYISLTFGGVFVDKYGQSVICGVNDGYFGAMANALAVDGYYGTWTNGDYKDNARLSRKGWNWAVDFNREGYSMKGGGLRTSSMLKDDNIMSSINIDITTDNYQGDHYAEDFFVEMCQNVKDGKNFGDIMYQHSQEISDTVYNINKKPSDRIIYYRLGRNQNIVGSSTIWASAGIIVGVALLAVGVGAAIAGPLSALAAKAGKTGGKLQLKDCLNEVTGLAVGTSLLPDKSPLIGYVQSGFKAEEAYKNGNPLAMLSAFGVGKDASYMESIYKLAQDNDITTLMKNSKLGYDDLSKLSQNTRNVSLPYDLQTALDTGDALKAITGGNLVNSPEMLKLMTANSSGGLSAAVPLKGQSAYLNRYTHLVPEILKNDKNFGISNIDAHQHNSLIRMANGLPIDSNVFDEVTIAGLEAQLSRKGNLGSLSGGTDNRTLCIPAGIPADKRECFAKYLKCRGFNIVIGSAASVEAEKRNPVTPLVPITKKTTTTTDKKVMVTVKKREAWR